MLNPLVRSVNRLRFLNRLRVWKWKNFSTARSRRDARKGFLSSWEKQSSGPTYRRTQPHREPAGLALGLATGYREADLEVFLVSFRLFNPLDRLILVFDRPPDSAMQTFLANHGAEGIVYPSIRLIEENMMNSRFELFSIILQSVTNAPEWVLLTDTRDVFFQNSISDAYNFFRRSTGSELFFASEDRRHSIASCKYNRFWFEFAFGATELERFGSLPISCAGTTLGSYSKILHYLDRQSYWFRVICETSSLGRTINSDQAIHNMIVHSGEVPGTHILSNGDLFLTAGYVKSQSLSFSDSVAYDGVYPTIIHQYDRMSVLEDHIRKNLFRENDKKYL